jgi:hypothetical protein
MCYSGGPARRIAHEAKACVTLTQSFPRARGQLPIMTELLPKPNLVDTACRDAKVSTSLCFPAPARGERRRSKPKNFPRSREKPHIKQRKESPPFFSLAQASSCGSVGCVVGQFGVRDGGTNAEGTRAFGARRILIGPDPVWAAAHELQYGRYRP